MAQDIKTRIQIDAFIPINTAQGALEILSMHCAEIAKAGFDSDYAKGKTRPIDRREIMIDVDVIDDRGKCVTNYRLVN